MTAGRDVRGWSHHKTPCAECPWRTDVETGRFPVERFREMASTSYDMAQTIFTCHKSAEDYPVVCAGFLLRGAEHNLTVRMMSIRNEIDWLAVEDGGRSLHENYREMAVANGVDPDDECLEDCR